MSDSNASVVPKQTLEEEIEDYDYSASAEFFPTANSHKPIIQREYRVVSADDPSDAAAQAYRRLEESVGRRLPDARAPDYRDGLRDGKLVYENGAYVRVSTKRL